MTRVNRLAPALLGTAALLFLLGLLFDSIAFNVASLAAAGALLATLTIEDRRTQKEQKARLADASARAKAAAPVAPVVDEAKVADALAAAEAARGEIETIIDIDRNTVIAKAADGTSVEVDLDKGMDVEDLLAGISGVGPAKVAALAEAFPTPVQLRTASADELTAVKGVGPALAERIKKALA